MSPRAVLIGLPGTGKSTTGRRLAKILAVPFADTDDLVEKAQGRDVRRIFAESGEDAFRAIEAETVEAALLEFDGILALGGGALMTASVRDAICASAVPVVLLQASTDTLASRVGDAHTRPLLCEGPQRRLAELAEQRGPTYRAAATITVETDSRTPGQVAATVAAKLHERARSER